GAEVGVAVGDEEPLAQQARRLPQRGGRADGLRAVERRLHPETEPCAVAHGVCDLLSEMSHAEHDATRAVRGEQSQLVEDERLLRARAERLRRVARATGPA